MINNLMKMKQSVNNACQPHGDDSDPKIENVFPLQEKSHIPGKGGREGKERKKECEHWW